MNMPINIPTRLTNLADTPDVPQTAVEIRQHVNRIQEVMHAVFKNGVHYGTIPGAGDRPVLFKPGAEVLAMTFRIAPEFQVEDLGNFDEIRYRVTCTGRHQLTGMTLGQGTGEASTNEEKYRWRAAICDEEYELTPIDRRRTAFKKRQGGFYTVKQVRTNPADLANTVLKMAAKRAQVAMTLNVTGASDCFTQDIEDLPEELRPQAGEDGATAAPRRSYKPRTSSPRASRSEEAPPADTPAETVSGPATPAQIGLIRKKLDNAGVPEATFLKAFQLDNFEALPFAKVNECLAWIAAANAP